MSDNDYMQLASDHGVAVGQLALAEMILTDYSDDVSPGLQRFLQKVSSKSAETIGKNVEKPAEDVTLIAQQSLASK